MRLFCEYLNYSEGIKNPDQLFTYNFQYISNLYWTLGAKGIDSYTSMLYMDFAYLSISALGWSLLLKALVRKKKWFIMLPLFMAFFAILQKLIAPNVAIKTVSNIVASEGLFRIGICCFLIVAILDIIVAWALYVFLKPVNIELIKCFD